MNPHTFAMLELSASAFEEVKEKLTAAGYSHAFTEVDGKPVIDMHGIGVVAVEDHAAHALRIERKLNLVLERLEHMSKQLDDLTAAVAAEKSVVGSAVTLLTDLKAKLDAALASLPQDDGAALQALSSDLGEQTSALAAAVAANTPADVPAAG